LLKELDGGRGGDKVSREAAQEALIPLLVAKGIITQEELNRKARELEAVRGR
jgi:hypothetical protein